MTKQFTITLSDVEEKALTSVVLSVQEWLENAAHVRSQLAVEAVAKTCVEKCLETNTQIPGSKEAMVELAFQRGWVQTVEQQNSEAISRTPGI